MRKIEVLTKNQEARLEEYRDKWLEIGLSTKPANKKEAEKWCIEAYKVAGLKPPKQIIWSTSPLAGVLVATTLKKLANKASEASVGASVGASVWASVEDSVGASVWDSVEDSVGASVWASVRASVGASVGASVWASVRASVWASVEDSVGASVRASVWDSVGDSVHGQHDAYWLGFYNYFQEVLKLKSCDKLLPLMNLSKDCGWWLPYSEIAILQEKTTKVELNESGIHCENAPAIAYSDGFEVYALNGVRIPKEIILTPANKLKSDLILKERNVEIRREIVRKIGIEKVLKDLKAKRLDKLGSYELLSLDLQDGRERPFLKMSNPSIDAVHVEGVPPEIKTVAQALAWRNGFEDKYVEPQILT